MGSPVRAADAQVCRYKRGDKHPPANGGRKLFLDCQFFCCRRGEREIKDCRRSEVGANSRGSGEHGNIRFALLVGGDAVAGKSIFDRIIGFHTLRGRKSHPFGYDIGIVLSVGKCVFETFDTGLEHFDDFAPFGFDFLIGGG